MKVERVACRTPTKGRDGTTSIPRWKFDLLRGLVLELVRDAGPEGLPFARLADAVAMRLSDGQRTELGSVAWHVTTVKLELETRGELHRLDARGPQRLII